MVQPSRRMPPFVAEPVTWVWKLIGYAVLAGLAGGYAWLLWDRPLFTLGVSGTVFGAFALAVAYSRKQFRAVATARGAESLCTFTRALPVRELDTWVIRAVFEQLQGYLQGEYPSFPLRPSDRLVEDLKIDTEDLDDLLVIEIGQRTGRDFTTTEGNPYYGKVQTVEDLIRFVCAQPKRAA